MGKWRHGNELKRVDSLVESVYNSEKNLEWENYRPQIEAPLCTEASDADFNLFEKSSTEEDEDNDQEDVINVKTFHGEQEKLRKQ